MRALLFGGTFPTIWPSWSTTVSRWPAPCKGAARATRRNPAPQPPAGPSRGPSGALLSLGRLEDPSQGREGSQSGRGFGRLSAGPLRVRPASFTTAADRRQTSRKGARRWALGQWLQRRLHHLSDFPFDARRVTSGLKEHARPSAARRTEAGSRPWSTTAAPMSLATRSSVSPPRHSSGPSCQRSRPWDSSASQRSCRSSKRAVTPAGNSN